MKVTQETHDKVVKIVNETLDQARRIWPSSAHKILPLSVEWFDTSVRTAGLAHMGRNKVSFNAHYIGEEDFWTTTIKHEVAHHIQYWIYTYARQAHGPEFRLIMSLLGCSGRTRHSMSPQVLMEAMPNEYCCPQCDKTINVSNIIHKRIQMGQRRYCRCSTGSFRKPIVLKSSVKSKEVSVKEIIPEHKVNLVSTPAVVPASLPVVSPRLVPAAKLSDIIPKGWWNS